MKVYLATRPVDFRKGSEEGQKTVRGTVFPTNGLALAVQEMLGLDPFCGAVFARAGARTLYGGLPRGKGATGFWRLVCRSHVYGV